ncbi:hypothetical protein [Novosphingobium sp. P6W]|uniref:hypothetical protein n=1 Tax=Novosphingobium sp. P6W TaxID=1609758 RepID=UPI0009E34661|nr:hypothetical protein [Novosphingobium sp. P6W]AXB80435.1 hypothetical protein TQ38_028160 [Novosphingobium sp. P6W]
MSAYSDTFPWPSHSGGFAFFEQRMREHSRVLSIESNDEGLYHLATADGRILVVFICECYSYGCAEYLETTSKLGKVDVVVINSNWCGYTEDLKFQCRSDQIGLFNIRDFMAALNRRDYWLYLNDWDSENFKERGLL